MRLHRQDEIVEAMARTIPPGDKVIAAAALDALLNAAVRLEVGREGVVLDETAKDYPAYVRSLILRLESHTDDA